MLDFIRLQLKLKWGLNRNNSKRNAILTAVAAFLAAVVALALVWGLSYVLKSSIEVTAKRLSVLFITILMLGLTVFATSMQINRLYMPADLKITARFPLSPFKIFICSLILNYIDLMIYSSILLVPIMLVFGWAMGSITFVYVLGIILGAIFLPLIPFGLSVFLAIPIMYINSLLKKHNIIKLVLFIAFLAGLLALYYVILTELAKFFIYQSMESGTLEIWKVLIDGLDKWYNPGYYIANIIFFDNFWLGLGVVIGAAAVLIGIGTLVAKFVYQHIRRQMLDGGETGTRVSKLDNFGSTRAMFRHTFLDILHTKSYSYFYLGVAVSTPVMVFFCHKLVSMVGLSELGTGINFGASILVMAVFMAMIGSFAALTLSLEGRNFYITKLVPVRFRKQLLIKAAINIAVSIGALLLGVIVLVALQFIGAVETIVLLISQILFVIGLVFNGLNINLVNPNLKPKANGEAEEINITYMLLIGFVIAAIFGALSLVLPKVVEGSEIYLYFIVIGISLIYSLVNFLVFWFTSEKKYRKIEV